MTPVPFSTLDMSTYINSLSANSFLGSIEVALTVINSSRGYFFSPRVLSTSSIIRFESISLDAEISFIDLEYLDINISCS